MVIDHPGVVGFVLATGSLPLYPWLAKRKKRAGAAEATLSDATPSDDDSRMPPEADAAFGVHKLTPNDRKSELDDFVVSELGGGSGRPSELIKHSSAS